MRRAVGIALAVATSWVGVWWCVDALAPCVPVAPPIGVECPDPRHEPHLRRSDPAYVFCLC